MNWEIFMSQFHKFVFYRQQALFLYIENIKVSS